MQRMFQKLAWSSIQLGRAGAAQRGAGLSWTAGTGRAEREGTDGAGLGCAVPSGHLAAVLGPAVPRRRIPVAVLLIRKIGLPHCCGREGWVGRGGEERGCQGRAEWAMWGGWAREAAGVARWGGQQRRGRVVRVGGRGAVRRGPGRGWGVPGMHMPRRSSRAG